MSRPHWQHHKGTAQRWDGWARDIATERARGRTNYQRRLAARWGCTVVAARCRVAMLRFCEWIPPDAEWRQSRRHRR
jgi:hypothetical protein